MNQMWKPQDVSYLPPGEGPAEHTDRSRRAWDDRMGDYVNRHRTDRLITCSALAIAAFATFGYFQKESHFIPPSTIVRDTAGDIVAVVRGDASAPPDDAQVGADLKNWVKNARSIYLDANALRSAVLAAYAPIKGGAPAMNQLNEFLANEDPFKRAQKEVVVVVNDGHEFPTALPIDSSANGQLRTFRVEWTEIIQARDGRMISKTPWWAEITYVWQPPSDEGEVKKSPDGIWINSFRWAAR